MVKTPRKRGRRGEGSIWKRADGTYQGRLYVRDALGRPKRENVYGRTQGEVRTKLLNLKSDRAKGKTGSTDRSKLSALLDRWDTAHAETVRDSTMRGYRSWVRTHLKPILGHLELREITPLHVQAMLDEMKTRGASPRTRQKALVTLKTAFESAIDWGMIDSNPAQRTKSPRVEKRDRPFWSPAQVSAFLDAARGDRLYALYLTALATGMREGELLALKWSAVELDNGLLRVSKTLDAATHELENPKTSRSKREIDIPPPVVGALRAHRKRMLAEGHPQPWVFPASNGSPLRPSNFLRYSFKPTIALADALARSEASEEDYFDPDLGVPLIHFHDLRHTAGVLMRRAGIDLKTISDRLGHASMAFTQDTYGHILVDADREASRALARVFGDLPEAYEKHATPT